MKSINCIIVDDERLARVNLRNLLKVHNRIEVIDEADSCESAIQKINALNPRLVFLDIQLSGETGFDVVEQIDSSVKVIFVTAYDEYAVRAFEVNAVDYLLKPVNPERLSKAIDRIFNVTEAKQPTSQKYNYDDVFYARLNNSRSKFIKISSICSIHSVGNYTKVVSQGNNSCLVLKTMKDWENSLPSKHFVRIHRSTIVNIEQIDRIVKEANGAYKAYIKNSTDSLEISRRYATKLKTLHEK